MAAPSMLGETHQSPHAPATKSWSAVCEDGVCVPGQPRAAPGIDLVNLFVCVYGQICACVTGQSCVSANSPAAPSWSNTHSALPFEPPPPGVDSTFIGTAAPHSWALECVGLTVPLGSPAAVSKAAMSS